MADHNPQHGRRPHFHRGRRGPDRRGGERRLPPRERDSDTASRETRETKEPRDSGNVDVEQIMRDIRARIAQRHGIELNNQQIQELAARRLEAILEPRNIKPQLLEQLRRSAGTAPEIPAPTPLETYEFEDTTLYETHRGIVSFFRKLLNPILKLFFNPTPLINALNTQVRINKALAARELERERRQSEWNALQYELVQRTVLETSRVSIEMQALAARIESLSAKVDFNDRKVRALDNSPTASAPPSRPAPPRHQEPVAISAPQPEAAAPDAASAEGTGEARRRRRRRRGRRGGGSVGEQAGTAGALAPIDDEADAGEGADIEDDEVITSEAANGAGPEAVGSAAVETTSEAVQSTTSAPSEPEAPPPAAPPIVPTPPRDEPRPDHPVDHAEAGPEDR